MHEDRKLFMKIILMILNNNKNLKEKFHQHKYQKEALFKQKVEIDLKLLH